MIGRGLMAVLVSALLGVSAWPETRLGVMTFNVRYGTANDGPNAWEQRKEILTDTIKRCAPDLIGTQECLDFQADFIVKKLPEYAWFGPGREKDGSGEHVAIFYRKDLLTPLETGQFWLSKTPEVPGSKDWGSHHVRLVTWARFRHVPSGRQFHHFNTHLDNGSEEARREGAKLLLQRINAIPTGHVIVTGDFNDAGETGEPWKILASGGLADCWPLALKQIGPAATWGAFKAPESGVKGGRIDWVLVRGAAKVESCETVLDNKDGRYPSDHYPVFAVIALGD